MKRLYLISIIGCFFISCLSQKSHSGSYNVTFIINPIVSTDTEYSPKDISEIIYKRLLNYGLSEKQITVKPTRKTIIIELKGVDDTSNIKRLVKVNGRLEFREAYSNKDLFQNLITANTLIRQLSIGEDKSSNPLGEGYSSILESDSSSGYASSENIESESEQNPLFEKLIPAITMNTEGHPTLTEGSVIGHCKVSDTAVVMRMLTNDSVTLLFPKNIRFTWHTLDPQNNNLCTLFAVNFDSLGARYLKGNFVEHVSTEQDVNEFYKINLQLDKNATKEFYLMTKKNTGKYIAILLDGKVLSAPRVTSPIQNGKMSISGEFYKIEALMLNDVLNYKYLPYKVSMVVN